MILPILTTLITAEISARDDFRQIGDNEKIRHFLQWCIRAAIVGAACLADWYWFNGPWYTVIGMAGLFSAFFRWRLNRMNDDWWWYLGPRLDQRGSKDSRYDTVFHWLVWTFTGRRTDHEGYYVYCDECPGKLAYIVELVVFAVVLYCAHA